MYSLIYEDENFLIVNKESGVLVHKTPLELRNLIDEVISERGPEHYLIHRIDKYTSGIVLIAKNKDTLRLTQKLFSEGKIEKTYLAIVSKELPAKKLKIMLSLGRNKNNKLMFSNRNAKNYKLAQTNAEIIKGRFIKLVPITGRTHQIRAHLNAISCPVLNDPIYGKNIFDKEFGQYLHAYRISFTCPIRNKSIVAIADLPFKFLEMLKDMSVDSWEI